MIHIKEAIVVEGKYDKEQLKKVTDAPIICTNGFRLYRSRETLNSIRRFAKTRGILILTDSDRAGFQIRSYLRSCLGADCIIKNAYIPAVSGKEKRKEKPGKEGLLGVEGMDESTLLSVLQSAATAQTADTVKPVTKADFFNDGFTGHPDSRERREKLIAYFRLPPRISANALLDLINQIGGYDAYQDALRAMHAKDKKTP